MSWPSSPASNTHLDAGTDDPGQARFELFGAVEKLNEVIAGRATANGVCELDGAGLIPTNRYETITVNSKMVFKQNWIPNGWNFVAEHNDTTMIFTSTQAEGGTTNGALWTVSGLTVGGRALTVGQLARHRHWTDGGGPYYFTGASGSNKGIGDTSGYTSYEGNDQEHDHPISQNGSWRPPAVLVITCQKA